MRVAVANIAKWLTTEKAKQDTAHVFSDGEVVMANELASSRHRRLFRQRAHTHAASPAFGAKVDVAIPNHWHAYGRKIRLTRFVLGVNPSRYMNVVFCPDQDKTVFGAVHMTNGAWNQRKKRTKAIRRRLWLKQQKAMRSEVRRWLALGWNVVIAGDMNRRLAPYLHPDQVVVGEEYMHIICIPAPGYEVVISGEQVRFKVNSDHPQVSANVRFVKA